MRRLRRFAYPYAAWMVIFVAVPLAIVIYSAFTDMYGHFSLVNFKGMGLYSTVFIRSFKLAIISTLICLIIGYPMAYFMSKAPENKQPVLLMLIMLPMWMNFLLRTYAWLTILENNGLLNRFLTNINLPTIHIINTPTAVALGMVYNYLPFMILPIYTALTKMDYSIIEAAMDLGCNKQQVIRKVIIPLSKPGVISGITMCFAPAVSTFIISKILGGGGNMLVGDLIELEFVGGAYNPNLGAAISIILMIIVVVMINIGSRFDDRKEGVLWA